MAFGSVWIHSGKEIDWKNYGQAVKHRGNYGIKKSFSSQLKDFKKQMVK